MWTPIVTEAILIKVMKLMLKSILCLLYMAALFAVWAAQNSTY